MDEVITTDNKTTDCIECKNAIKMDDDSKVGDVTECEYCGIEYEVKEKQNDGEFKLQLIEEEK